MRPVKQLGVVCTHCLITFGPGTASVGAALMLLHASREGFLFVAACMLTYRYHTMAWSELGRLWRRRLVAVGLPYLCWTVIYFLIGLPGFEGSAWAAAGSLGLLVLTGYSQLYFLIVLLQFYLLFPLVLCLLRRTRRHHAALVVASLVVQLAYTSLIHWNLVPSWLQGPAATREVWSYQLYLLSGCVAAIHYRRVHDWLVGHRAEVLAAFLASALAAEAWYWLAVRAGAGVLAGASDPFQPIVVPFNLAAIAIIYLAGVALVRPGTPAGLRRLTRVGSDNSYAAYLSQVAFIDLLAALGWRGLDLPWPLGVGVAVVAVMLAGCALGGLVGRTRLAWPLVGRHQATWASLRPWFLAARPVRPWWASARRLWSG